MKFEQSDSSQEKKDGMEKVVKAGDFVTAYVIPAHIDENKPFDKYRMGTQEGMIMKTDEGGGKVKIKNLVTGEIWHGMEPKLVPDEKVPEAVREVLQGERQMIGL